MYELFGHERIYVKKRPNFNIIIYNLPKRNRKFFSRMSSIVIESHTAHLINSSLLRYKKNNKEKKIIINTNGFD